MAKVMVTSLPLLTLFFFLTSLALTKAHSTVIPTVQHSESVRVRHHDVLSHPQLSLPTLKKRDLERDTFPSLVQKGDLVRLQLRAFNSVYYFHLEPNLHLLHPEIDLSPHKDEHDDDFSVEDIRAFKGVVVGDALSSERLWAKTTQKQAVVDQNEDRAEQWRREEGVLGWARMMVVQDDSSDLLLLQGAFEVNGEMYHITTRQHYHAQKRDLDHMPSTDDPSQPDLIIYRDSDLNTPTSPPSPDDISPAQTVCGTQSQANTQSKRSYSDSNPLSSASTAHLARRQLISNSTSSPNSIPPGCPTSRKVNYMGIAADCTYVRNYGGKANARRQILSDMNTASQIYESTFNVVLSIQTMTIMSMNCPSTPVNGTEWNQACSPLYDIGERLSDFSRWRGRTYNKDGAGLWHLMTRCNSGSIIGIAWTGALCQMNAQAQGNQYSSGTGVSSVSTNEWLVVAHEIGHGFGAQHDCTASTCGTNSTCCALNSTVCDAKNKYIMNPSELTATTQFSPCTISTICKAISSSAGSCLKPATIQASQVDNGNNTLCGNGVLDPGEQCDCGTSDQCAKDNCCDGDTCRFKNNAVCDDLNDDCCNSCQFAPATQVCRSALSPSCDLPEMCSGLSAACPPDIRIPDLTSCSASGNVTGQCASGICTSRDLQCVQQERPGISKACKALPSSCELVCNDPNGSTSMCTRISGNYFVDGTPCGDSMDSVCRRGRCQPLESWAKRNMGLLIGVCVGGVALLSGLVVMIFCIRRRRRRHAMKSSGEKVKHEAQWAATTESRISQSIPRRTSQVGPMLQNPHSASVPGTTGHPLPVGPSPRLEPAVQASPSVPMGPAFNSTRPVHPLDVDPEAQA